MEDQVSIASVAGSLIERHTSQGDVVIIPATGDGNSALGKIGGDRVGRQPKVLANGIATAPRAGVRVDTGDPGK